MEFNLARDNQGEDQIQENLNLEVHKSMKPADMHPLVLRELANGVALVGVVQLGEEKALGRP